MELSPRTVVAGGAAIALGAVLQSATGLGSGLVSVPLLAHLDMRLVPGPIIFASMALSSVMAWVGRRDIQFAGLGAVMAGMTAGSIAAAATLSLWPPDRAAILFGSLILAGVVLSVAGVRLLATGVNLFGAGAVAGLMGTIAGVGAPALALAYQHEPAPRLRATLAFIYLLASVLMMITLHFAGRFGIEELVAGLWLVPGFLVGYAIAQPLARRIDDAIARAAVLAVSAIGGISLVARGF